MRMLEYESKQLFRENGIPVPDSIILHRGDNLHDKLSSANFPVIIKAQVPIGSRKKAGLIKTAQNLDEAVQVAEEIFAKKVAGYQAEVLLVEGMAKILHEYYASIALDGTGRRLLLIASAEGGIDIEEVAKERPEAIKKIEVPLENLSKDVCTEVAAWLGLENEYQAQAADILYKLWEITLKYDSQLTEINPLVKTDNGMLAVDGKMILDDNAAYRQPLIQKLKEKKLTELEKLAAEAGFSYVPLEGEIGILANGAGLTMALLDLLSDAGLKPANFLDVGGGASAERVYKALSLLFKLKPKAILINIFGGITRCDVVANGVLQALESFKGQDIPPLVIRLTGTKEKEGVEILSKAGISAYRDMMDAVDKIKSIVEAA